MLAQLTVGPIEILAAASIVYFALPEAGNPGYLVVLGIFVVAFSIASISHAPGGLGVFEFVAWPGSPTWTRSACWPRWWSSACST